jgi:hypothetical protein
MKTVDIVAPLPPFDKMASMSNVRQTQDFIAKILCVQCIQGRLRAILEAVYDSFLGFWRDSGGREYVQHEIYDGGIAEEIRCRLR